MHQPYSEDQGAGGEDKGAVERSSGRTQGGGYPSVNLRPPRPLYTGGEVTVNFLVKFSSWDFHFQWTHSGPTAAHNLYQGV